jgi:hypothetical protein
MGEGEMREMLSIHPCGTSRVILHAVKSYMGPSRFTYHPRGRCAADFYELKLNKRQCTKQEENVTIKL